MLESKNISKYFARVFGHIQSNKKIWGEDGRNTCGRENPTLAIKEVLLCGGHDKEVAKYGCSFNTRSRGKIAIM
jgi:hypothetical protein